MGQPVEQRSGHLGVAKDRRPFAEVEIGRHDDRGALVEAADEMEQQLAAGLSEGKIAEFVEDQEVEAAQQVCGASLSIGTGFGIELVYQVYDIEEAPPLAAPDAGPGDADGKVRFTSPGAAPSRDIAARCPDGQWMRTTLRCCSRNSPVARSRTSVSLTG